MSTWRDLTDEAVARGGREQIILRRDVDQREPLHASSKTRSPREHPQIDSKKQGSEREKWRSEFGGKAEKADSGNEMISFGII